MKKFPRISAALNALPWAIEPRALDVLCAIVDKHIAGEEPAAVQPRTNEPEIYGSIAIVPIRGPIVPRASLMSAMSGATSSEDIAQSVAWAANNDDIGAIVLDIDSPGGSVIGAFETADVIFEARKQKRVMASINGVGASLAYLYASQADEVFASRGSHVGSIGVIARYMDDSRAEKNEGVDTITVASSPRKANSGMTPEQIREQMKSEVDRLFGMMKEAISRSRAGMDMFAVATGDVWVADEAEQLGLVDRIATLDEIIRDAKNVLT